jgi:hypothetical protein
MRMRHALVSALLALLVCANPLFGQSLADVARAEEARRKSVKGTAKVYTNDDLKGGREADPTPPPVPTAGAKADAPKAEAAKPDAEKPKPEESGAPKDEKYWRDRMVALRNAVARNKVLADALQSRVNALNTDFANMDDPVQRATIEQNRRTALAEMDRMKQETEKLNKEIVALEEEARRASVPPGWLR